LEAFLSRVLLPLHFYCGSCISTIRRPPSRDSGFLAAAQCSAERSEHRALCMGLHFIKRKKWRAHRASMLSAFGFSSLFFDLL
jgi:hypothetical protein